MAGNVLAGSFVSSPPPVFGTTGPDTYADGQLVADNEYYALIWTPDEFRGFNFDGSLVSDSDKLIVMAPLARSGHCPTTVFQLPDSLQFNGGKYLLYLLDTRLYNLSEVAPAKTAIHFINGYSPVGSTSEIRIMQTASRQPESAAEGQPVIKGIKVKDENVQLKVECLPGSTVVLVGENLRTFFPWGTAVQTESKQDVEWNIPVTGRTNIFFKALLY